MTGFRVGSDRTTDSESFALSQLAASHLILDGKRETETIVPALIACNLASVFNHGVLSLPCGSRNVLVRLGHNSWTVNGPSQPTRRREMASKASEN
jgi:hypothetical protein